MSEEWAKTLHSKKISNKRMEKIVLYSSFTLTVVLQELVCKCKDFVNNFTVSQSFPLLQ